MPDLNKDKRKKSKLSGLSSKADKLKDSGKSALDKGIQTGKAVTEKVTETAGEAVKKIDKTIKKVGQEISDEIIKQSVKTGTKARSSSPQGGIGSSFEKQLFSWYGWAWSVIGYIFIILIAFSISVTNHSYALLPIILLIGFPFFMLWMIYNIIPEVTIGGKTIISRKQFSLRKQLSFGGAIARTFSREMMKNSPEMAFIIGIFLLLLGYVLIAPFF